MRGVHGFTERWRPAQWLVVALLPLCVVGGATQSAHAQVILQEDFEDGNLASRGWYDLVGWGSEMFLSTTERRSGNASLEVRYAAGSTGPWMRHQFAGQDRIYTRYYRKWASSWIWPTSFGPHDTYVFGMYGQQWFAPTQTYVTIYTESIYPGPPDWQFGSVGLQVRGELQGGISLSPASLSPPTPRFELNRWYCIETLATMNTAGSSDGRLQLWLDGTLMYDVNGVVLRNAANSTLQFDVFMFGPFFHGGTTQVQSTWLDALVIATNRVGCLGSDSEPPAIPGNLRVTP